jgi:Tol biopolymer transport system component
MDKNITRLPETTLYITPGYKKIIAVLTLVLFIIVIFLAILYWQITIRTTRTHSKNVTQYRSLCDKSDKNNCGLLLISTGYQRQKYQLYDVVTDKKVERGFLSIFRNDTIEPISFSPDKKWLLYMKDQNLWKIDIDGKQNIQLTFEGKQSTSTEWGVVINSAAWSFDGRYISYGVLNSESARGTDEPLTSQQLAMKLPNIQEGTWIMKSDGSQKHLLFPYSDGTDSIPIFTGWLPKDKVVASKTVVKNSYLQSEKNYLFDLNGNQIGLMSYDGALGEISWNESGTIGLGRLNTDQYGTLWKYAIVNSVYRALYTVNQQYDIPPIGDSDSTTAFLDSAQVSPDGGDILFSKLIRPYGNEPDIQALEDQYDNNSQVYIWNTKTNEITKVPLVFQIFTDYYWTKDSTKIIYFNSNFTDPSRKICTYDIYLQHNRCFKTDGDISGVYY